MNSDYSIIIPVFKLAGNKYINQLLQSIAEQAHRPLEVHIVSGDSRQGRSINYGASVSKTKYIATLDDDSIIDDASLFEKLVKAMESDTTIGIGGASCLIPGDASPLQKKAMREIPRRFFPVQKNNIDSDMVQHPCLIMEREYFNRIGGEDESLVRGLDPVLRKKSRDAGKRVVIIADTWVYHALPSSIWEIMKMYYRNGRGSGFALKYYPEKILELTDGYDKGSFVEKRPVSYRFIRRVIYVLTSLMNFKFIRFLMEISYTAGVIKEYLYPGYTLKKPEIDGISTSEKAGYPFKCILHEVKLRK
ncbi:MAG TPA: hypothetical protein DCZ94_07660 [Lentisphaeria bacterium]|nr:MAG: hypothetical protein A2X48_14340 [Lentisphaerae bacterium GWF2_49_21]HBC86813.1 hypothetical protein [Lentisphaeria bacterium]